MMRFVLMIAAGSFGLTLLLFNGSETAQAQTPRTDTIRLMAATRGTSFDGTGLKWCVSQTWHRGIPGSNLVTALDEVPQTAAGCPSSSTEQVELAVYGLTDDASCTLSSPCPSLRLVITSGEYPGGCDFIDARLFDQGTGDNFRGRHRMLHAGGPSGYTFTLHVTSGVWYSTGSNWTTVGTVTDDINCMTAADPPQPGFTQGGYHVHQDFMPPTTSENCQWNTNTSTNFATNTSDRRRDDPDIWYLYSLTHVPGVSCIVPGPRSADFLLREGGELDGPIPGSGEGARSLATTGGPITTASTCFTGTSWCGTMTVTQPLLLAARQWYLNNVQYAPPPSQSGAWVRWYEDAAGYFFDVNYSRASPGGGTYCGVTVGDGAPLYFLYVRTSVNFVECGQSYGNTAFPSVSMTISTARSAFGKFRGQGGACPGCPPTQEEANTWTDVEIATGNWATKVKPAIDAVIRAAADTGDMAALGITGNPPFDGDLGQVEMAGVMDKTNILAARDWGVPLSGRVRDEMSRDWIRSASLSVEPGQ